MTVNISVKELSSTLDLLNTPHKVYGNLERYVSTPAPIDTAVEGSLVFCSRQDDAALTMLRATQASVVIISNTVILDEDDYRDRTIIRVANPRLAYIKLLQAHFVTPPEYGIHPTAVIDPGAKIHDKVFIGPFSYIGQCEIDEDTVIHSNVHIFPKTRIGKRVTVFPGAVIGRDGYGFERNDSGRLERFPQIGGVIIEDDVEIGSNTVVDRGALSNTFIGEGSKIDNLCHIAHSVNIGKYCMVIALSIIGGSTKIGDYCHIAPSASLMNKIEIGKNVTVGMGSVVTKNIADNQVVIGVPAKPIRENV
jgi:UDP-3-O-[3-hydroxymyristoyl] glucosamine N-acyltransferase